MIRAKFVEKRTNFLRMQSDIVHRLIEVTSNVTVTLVTTNETYCASIGGFQLIINQILTKLGFRNSF